MSGAPSATICPPSMRPARMWRWRSRKVAACSRRRPRARRQATRPALSESVTRLPSLRCRRAGRTAAGRRDGGGDACASDDRPFAAQHAPAIVLDVDRPQAGVRQLVRDVSALRHRRPGAARHLRRRHRAAAGDPRHGLRRAVFPADPSDRHDQPQGPQQRAARRRRTISAVPMRSAAPEGGHDAIHPAARHAGGLPRAGRRGAGARAGDRARLRHPVLARPSVAARASGLVPLAARRLDPLRREPAEEVRGHRQSRLLRRGRDARRCGSRCATWCSSGSTRACASSASTTRTPSRCRSGSG